VLAGLALLLVVATMSSATPWIRPYAASAYSIWGGATVPSNPEAGAVGAREVGTVFTTSERGYISALRFYKGPANTGTHVGRLSTANGLVLASATYANESASGWQEVKLRRPVLLTAGSTYIVSYTTNGRFAQDSWVFDHRTVSSGVLTATGGVAKAMGGAWGAAETNSYYADVVYSSSRRAGDVTSPTPTTTTPTTTTTTTTTTTPTTTPTTTTPPGLSLVPVDGGPGFYGRFASPLPTSPSYFPLGVWFESVSGQGDIDTDKAAGLNTYVELTDNSNVSALAGSGMNILTDNLSALGARKNGHLLADEVDMQYGPGAGYDVMRNLNAALPADGKIRYANYGKGVVFWESDADAARFVNEFQDFTSTDVYWYTDPDACLASQGGRLLGVNRNLSNAECHRASNYGVQVDKVRRLAGYDTPIWSYVELGNPWSSGGAQISPDQAAAAVWSSLIHGARGIVYFNHSFGGSCQSQHILRDPCYSAMRSRITAVNAQVTRLAPVLNAPRVDGLTTATGGVDTLTKWSNGSLYVFAGAQAAASTTARFALPCVGNATVTVIDENRTIPMSGGSFSDTFANDTSYHLYRIDGGSTCGLG
jgi:hypothetical protein